MSQTTFSKDRYPGLRSFDKSQSALFFGREREIEDLFNLISTEKTVVFFGKSGLGKSSLLEAGLSPELEKNGYLPVRIRFSSSTQHVTDATPPVNLLLRDFLDGFEGLRNEDAIIFDRDGPQLWEYIKATPFRNAAGEPVIPVFIFDQFEEFFYQPKDHQEVFLKQLAEVIHDQPPRRILEWITAIPAEERTPAQIHWHRQPELKAIFALRSDKLALMQSLAQYLPGVLRNRYELKPLNKIQAGEAIKLPAQKDMGEGFTPPFIFSEPLLHNIVDELGKGSNEIESSQLQMVCNYIENQVKEKAAADTPVAEVTDAIIDPTRDIQKIRDNFYEDQLLKNIPDGSDRELAKKVIEDDLVVDGQRASLLAAQLLARFDGKKQLTDALLKARLIREENTIRGITYEVSHDTLVPSIEKSKRKRHATEEELQREQERQQIAADNLRYAQEAKERIAQLQKESELRKEAEKQRQEAEKQKDEVVKQRSVARRYFLFACILGILAFAGGIYFFIDRQREAANRIKADHVGALLDSKTKELDSLSSLFNKYMLLDLEEGGSRAFTKKDTVAWDILQRSRYIDTVYNDGINTRQIDLAIEKFYKKTKQNQTSAIVPRQDDSGNKLQTQYLEQTFPDVKMRKQAPGTGTYDEKQWKTRKQHILKKLDSAEKQFLKN